MTHIPNSHPLWKRNSTGETARDAARAMAPRAPTLRQRVLEAIDAKPSSPEAILARLREAGVSTVLTSVRPRCSELVRLGLICDSGKRGRGEGGKPAIIWRRCSEAETAAYLDREVSHG